MFMGRTLKGGGLTTRWKVFCLIDLPLLTWCSQNKTWKSFYLYLLIFYYSKLFSSKKESRWKALPRKTYIKPFFFLPQMASLFIFRFLSLFFVLFIYFFVIFLFCAFCLFAFLYSLFPFFNGNKQEVSEKLITAILMLKRSVDRPKKRLLYLFIYLYYIQCRLQVNGVRSKKNISPTIDWQILSL